MKCERARRLWLEWDSGAYPALPREVEAHVEHCPACAAELARERALSEALRALAHESVPGVEVRARVLRALPPEPARARSRFWAAAAAAAALAVLLGAAGAAVWTWWTHGPALVEAGATALRGLTEPLGSLGPIVLILARAALDVIAVGLELVARIQPWLVSMLLAGLAGGLLWAVLVIGRELLARHVEARG